MKAYRVESCYACPCLGWEKSGGAFDNKICTIWERNKPIGENTSFPSFCPLPDYEPVDAKPKDVGMKKYKVYWVDMFKGVECNGVYLGSFMEERDGILTIGTDDAETTAIFNVGEWTHVECVELVEDVGKS